MTRPPRTKLPKAVASLTVPRPRPRPSWPHEVVSRWSPISWMGDRFRQVTGQAWAGVWHPDLVGSAGPFTGGPHAGHREHVRRHTANAQSRCLVKISGDLMSGQGCEVQPSSSPAHLPACMPKMGACEVRRPVSQLQVPLRFQPHSRPIH